MKQEMVQNGSDTLAAIERALGDLQTQERHLQLRLEETNVERTGLLEKRLGAFKELALARARHALADGVIDQADHLSEQVRGILAARLKSVSALYARRDKAERDRENVLSAQAVLAKDIAAHEAQLDELAEQARKELAGVQAYSAAIERRDTATAVHGKADKKAKLAETDRIAKGAPYENDPLFMYLWNRDYGRERYQANRLISWLDAYVAKLVGYHDARADYAVLREIPLRLAEHVKRLGTKLAEAQADVESQEAAKIVALAGEDLPRLLERTRKLQRAQNQELEKLSAELTEAAGQLNIYAEGRDPSFVKAIDISASFLEHESFARLRALARRTPEPSDDHIVERIRNLERKVETARKQTEGLQDKLERAFERKEELIRLSSDFRRSYYDDPGSIFLPGNDLEALLGELIRGAITGAQYWSRARSSHRWRDRPADPYRRSSNFPPLGGPIDWPDAGSNSDFRTGGGF